mmetsp:Transcript_32091/g.68396  ORF Transcript_32091/g.68396 Transcript_32091/m.68396 type:complete len:207 (-) Transcript_32091:1949-2569(-)
MRARSFTGLLGLLHVGGATTLQAGNLFLEALDIDPCPHLGLTQVVELLLQAAFGAQSLLALLAQLMSGLVPLFQELRHILGLGLSLFRGRLGPVLRLHYLRLLTLQLVLELRDLLVAFRNLLEGAEPLAVGLGSRLLVTRCLRLQSCDSAGSFGTRSAELCLRLCELLRQVRSLLLLSFLALAQLHQLGLELIVVLLQPRGSELRL